MSSCGRVTCGAACPYSLDECSSAQGADWWGYTFADWQYRADKGLLRGEHAIAAALCRECSGTLPAVRWSASYVRRPTDCHCERPELVSIASILASHGLTPAFNTAAQGVYADALGRIE